MKKVLFALPLIALLGAAPAQAGCIKGAILGGVAGHFMGKHAIAGAIAGCAIGRMTPPAGAKSMIEGLKNKYLPPKADGGAPLENPTY